MILNMNNEKYNACHTIQVVHQESNSIAYRLKLSVVTIPCIRDVITVR